MQHAHHWMIPEDLNTPAECRTCGAVRKFEPVMFGVADLDRHGVISGRSHLDRVVLNGWPFRTSDVSRMSKGIAR